MKPTYLSLFSGIGGLDLGFDRAGLECKGQVEINPFCLRVLKKHWPKVPKWGDITQLEPKQLPQVDVICGGFPCKQTSTAAAIHGRRKGLDGHESGLWFDMLRLVEGLTPRCVVVENPLGGASWADKIESGLAAIGYIIPGGVTRLSARDVGAPHLRRRLFWIAYRDCKGLQIARKARPSTIERLKRRTVARNFWRKSLARNLRVADGVPGGLDRRERITALGNAVTPQQAEVIGRIVVSQLKG